MKVTARHSEGPPFQLSKGLGLAGVSRTVGLEFRVRVRDWTVGIEGMNRLRIG